MPWHRLFSTTADKSKLLHENRLLTGASIGSYIPVAWDIWTPYIDACDCFQTSYSIACLQKDEEARVVGKTCRRNVRQGSNDRLTICFSIKQHDNRRSTFDVACLTQNRLYACSACRGCSVDNLCQVQLCLINTTSIYVEVPGWLIPNWPFPSLFATCAIDCAQDYAAIFKFHVDSVTSILNSSHWVISSFGKNHYVAPTNVR